MMIWFECKEESLLVGLETDTKPTMGEIIRIQKKDYKIKNIIWCLEEPPGQSGLKIEIEKA